MLGEEQMETIWKKYYDTWSFRHPNASSFVQTVNQVVSTSKKPKYGYNLHWFFNTYLFGSQVCDYEVIKIYNQERLPELGFFDKNGSLEEISDPQPQTADQTYWSRVDLRKNGTASFPVTVLCTFADGSTETKEWTGKENSITYWFDNKTTKLVSVEIDPEQINTMDINTINNSYTLEPDLSPFWKYALKLTFWFQNIIESFALFV
jgi:hypothetical protein